jgi:hypothetical protein
MLPPGVKNEATEQYPAQRWPTLRKLPIAKERNPKMNSFVLKSIL